MLLKEEDTEGLIEDGKITLLLLICQLEGQNRP